MTDWIESMTLHCLLVMVSNTNSTRCSNRQRFEAFILVTEQIIQYHQGKVAHLGQESVLSSLRESFWVVKGHSVVLCLFKKCLDCERRKAPTRGQLVTKLPKDKNSPHVPPFTYVGEDYFGPIEVMQGRSRLKRWGCLFTCLIVCAIDVEVAHSLNTDSMINMLRIFINLQRYPKEILSDHDKGCCWQVVSATTNGWPTAIVGA